jgi:Protein of unknown function (DUF2798)
MIPRRFAPLLFGFFLSGLMSLVVSGIATVKTVGWESGFLAVWTSSWLTAWLFAFPVVLIVAPLTRRVVEGLLSAEASNPTCPDVPSGKE